ncbi:hypothetical protein, partial [Ideonella sp.]|uniref:hypothetical protein n=1 Tax=Ideonella sp. TaxID=1929293 RepID=UPI003BB5183E
MRSERDIKRTPKRAVAPRPDNGTPGSTGPVDRAPAEAAPRTIPVSYAPRSEAPAAPGRPDHRDARERSPR